jgi:hypothetical protein
MSFFEDIFIGIGQEILFSSFKWIGISIKWMFYLGKKPISEIRKENWNTRIGFIVFLVLIGLIIYFTN